jgi:hypothetical protein
VLSLTAGRCNAAVASHTAFRNFCILAKGGVEFLVDGVLAISLCGAFEDIVKGEKVSAFAKSGAHHQVVDQGVGNYSDKIQPARLVNVQRGWAPAL